MCFVLKILKVLIIESTPCFNILLVSLFLGNAFVLATGATSGTGGPLSWGTNATAQIASYAGFPNELSGSVASVKYYNKKLSASEVLQNYDALKTRFGL